MVHLDGSPSEPRWQPCAPVGIDGSSHVDIATLHQAKKRGTQSCSPPVSGLPCPFRPLQQKPYVTGGESSSPLESTAFGTIMASATATTTATGLLHRLA